VTERRDPEIMFMETAWRLLMNVPDGRRAHCVTWLGEKIAAAIRDRISENQATLLDLNERLERWKADEPEAIREAISYLQAEGKKP
jgi:dienelactone hydrolase